MGNCSFKSVTISDAKESSSIRMMTDSGDILEFEGPRFTRKVLDNFPGYGIFRQGRISSPLPDNEELHGGQLYFLLPLGEIQLAKKNEHYNKKLESDVSSLVPACRQIVCEPAQKMEDSRNLNECPSRAETPRMLDNLFPAFRESISQSIQKGKNTGKINKESAKEAEAEPVRMSTSVEVLPPPQRGIWRVKFVIDTKQLEEILSEGVNTEALIEQMRLAASTGTITPRRTKISWGQLMPMLSNLFKGDQRLDASKDSNR